MATAGISRALLSSILRRSKNIQQKALNKPFSADYLRRAARYPDRNIIGGKRKTPKYTEAVSPTVYNNFVKDFAKAYKQADVEGITSLKSGMNIFGSNFFQNIKKAAKRKNFLDRADTDRIKTLQEQRFGFHDFTDPRYKAKQDLVSQQRAAIQDVYNDIIKKAPKDPNTGKAILSGKRELYPVSIIPKLKNKYPDLFAGVENNKQGQAKIYKITEATRSGSRKKMEYPDFQKASDNIEEQAMYMQVPNFTDEAELGKIPRQYLIDVFRSRPSEFVTGNAKKDANRYLRFLRDQNFFDPQSPYYYKKNPEFAEYYLTRKQPSGAVADYRRGLDLSHDVPTLMPGGSRKFPTQTQTVPFSGAEIGRTHYLSPNVNRILQPKLEAQAIDALQKKNYKKFVKLDEQMIKNNIRTTITDPTTGEVYPMGGYADIGFNRGGIASLLE